MILVDLGACMAKWRIWGKYKYDGSFSSRKYDKKRGVLTASEVLAPENSADSCHVLLINILPLESLAESENLATIPPIGSFMPDLKRPI